MARLGLGMAALGRPGYMTLGHAGDVAGTSREEMQQQAFSVLDAAYAGGIRHFDAARSYGEAEAFLRRWLDARGHSNVAVSTKWGYRYTAEWQASAPVHEVKDLSAAHLETQWAQSRETLGKALRVYQIHSVTMESGVLDDDDVLRKLERIKKEGVDIGLSVTGPKQAEVIRKALGFKLFTWVQATWNVLERSAEEALSMAHEHGLNVIVKEGLANGRLTARGDVQALHDLSRKKNVAADVLALGAVLAQPWAKVVLSGAATVEQLQSNLKAAPLESRDLNAMREDPEVYWAKRSQLVWS